MRAAILALLLTGCIPNDARAPEASNYVYVVRIAYIHDLAIKPHETIQGCEIPRSRAEKDLPDMPEYTKVVRCLPIGAR